MSQKHKKASSVAMPKREKPLIAIKVLKKNMCEINHVESLIGKQSVKWSFTKANRFSPKKPEKSSEFLQIKSSFGQGRSAGFGFGKRWAPSNPRGQDAPPSTKYSLPSSLDRKIVGGKISPIKERKVTRRWSNPGPGTYNIKGTLGNAVKFTLKGRHAAIARHCTPPPGTYNPSHLLVESGRYSSISFGGKTADNAGRFSTPGPGSYELASTFSSLSPSPQLKNRMKRKNSL